MGSTSSQPSENVVTEAVDENKVMLFSQASCPKSRNVKLRLNEVGATYAVMEVDKRKDAMNIQDQLHAIVGNRGLPQLFIRGSCVGGDDEVAELKAHGKLRALLRS